MPPRVLYVLDEFPGPNAGTEAQFWLLYCALSKATFRPRVVTLRPSPYLRSRLGPGEYECLAVGSLRSPASLWRALRFALRARREGFTVAHLFLNDVNVLMPPFLALAGIRTIVSRRDLGLWYDPRAAQDFALQSQIHSARRRKLRSGEDRRVQCGGLSGCAG